MPISVKFGADTEDLVAQIEIAKAQVKSFTREVNSLAASMVKTGATTDALKLQNLSTAAAGAAAASKELETLQASAGTAAQGIQLSTREISEGIRGAMDAAMGRTSMASESFLRMAISVGATNPGLIALGAAALAAAGGVAYLAYQEYQWVQATEKVELGNLINQVSMSREQIVGYVADIEKAADVSAADAQKIIAAFQQFGNAGQPIAELTAQYIPLLVEMGVKAPEAAKELAKYFSDLSGAGAKLVASVNDTTGALRSEFAAAQQAGDINRQYAIIVQALADKYGAASSALSQMKAPMADFQEMARLGGTESAGFALALESDSEAAQKAAGSVQQAADATRRWTDALFDADTSIQRFAKGAALVESLDKTDASIEKTRGHIAELTDYLNALKLKQVGGVDKSSEIAKTTAALKIEATALAELNEKKNAPTQQAQYGLELAEAQGDSAKKIAILKEEYQQKIAIYGADSAQAIEAMTRVVEAQNAAAKSAVKPVAEQYAAMVAAAEKAYSTAKTLADDAYKQTSEKLKAEASDHQITYGQETAALLAALDQRTAAETAALGQRYTAEYQAFTGEMAQGTAQWQAELDKRNAAYQAYLDELAKLHAKANVEGQKIDDDAVKEYTKQWNTALSSIEGAFNSQLRGLLAGTTTWSEAFKKILGDLIIKFIEMCEEMVGKWVAAQLAQTTAAQTGAAASAAAQEAGSAAGILGMVGNAVKAIMVDAGQAFAGVFAFLAPVMGPAAAGPAAAAQASVSAAAIFDVGTDYVVRGGLAILHPGEAVIPPAQGTGPYRGEAGGRMAPQVHAPVSIDIMGHDAQSFARLLNDNKSQLARTLRDAIRHGAHLGMRASRS